MCIYKYHYDKYLKKRLPIKLHYLKPSMLWRLFLRIRYEILNRFGLRLGSVDNFSHSNGYVVIPANFILQKKQIPTNEVLVTTVLLIKRKNIKSIIVNKIQSDQKISLAKYTSDVLRHEWSDYSKLMTAYSAFSGGFANELFTISDKVILNMFYKAEDVYEMLIPMNCNDNDIEFAVRSVL